MRWSVVVSCVEKHFRTLFALSKDPVIVKFHDSVWEFGGRGYKISPSFWRYFDCKQCGRCCISTRSIIFDGDVFNPNVRLIKENCYKDTVYVNDKEYPIFYSVVNQPCVFLSENKLCMIYENRPLLSRMPHLFFDGKIKSKGSISVLHRQYGRNWALGCESESHLLTSKLFEEDVLPKFLYLKDRLFYYNCDSWIDSILTKVDFRINKRFFRSLS